MKRKYILFDFDGVIADTEGSNTVFLGKALALFGITLTKEDIYSLTGNNGGEPLLKILERAVPPIEYEPFMAIRRSMGNTYENGQLIPLPGIYELLENLKKAGIRMALVSSTSQRLIIRALERMNLTGYFEVVICGDTVKEHKPSPVPYHTAMGLLKAAPEECIVIEDSEVGIRAGKASGAYVIGYRGSELSQNTALADVSIDSYDELYNMDLGITWAAA